MGVQLEVERSGGFGGLVLRGSFEFSQLSPEQQEAVRGCLARAAGRPPTPPSGPDRFVYRLRLGASEAQLQEEELPEPLHPLLEGLGFNQGGS